MTTALDAIVDLGPNQWRDARQSGQLEWLSTNGLGGYACGTVGGMLQRRWHGLLVAATDAPAGRTMLVPKIELFATVDGTVHPLTANEWAGAGIDAPGLGNLIRLHMNGSVIVRHWRIGSALLEERITMARGRNATAVLLTLRHASKPVQIAIKCLVNHRPHDHLAQVGAFKADITQQPGGLRVQFEGAQGEGSQVHLQADGCAATAHRWKGRRPARSGWPPRPALRATSWPQRRAWPPQRNLPAVEPFVTL